jgi:elongation factor P--(R)-beta-lysine ligase
MADAAWRPLATRETLQARADLYRSVRAFFDARGVLEVETPLLSAHATVDRHIESFATTDGRWLQTSPEFAMKRLLAAGSGPIWQIAKVFRREEAGRHHNPEFSLLEWYRPGFDHHALMSEVESLLQALGAPAGPYARRTYREAFLEHAGFDPWAVTTATLRELPQADALPADADRDSLLDLWMSHRVGPQLGLGCPAFLYDFPASQAALARVVDGCAQRFELFWDGLELANGFWELLDAEEQAARFEADLRWRRAQGHDGPPPDRHLLEALRAGLPDCAGVALGLDRLLMKRIGAERLESVLAFPQARA